MSNGRNRSYRNVMAARRAAAEQRKVAEQKRAKAKRLQDKKRKRRTGVPVRPIDPRLKRIEELKRARAGKRLPAKPAPRPLPSGRRPPLRRRSVRQPARPKIAPIKKAVDEKKEFASKPFKPKPISRPSSRPTPRPKVRPRPAPTPRKRTVTATVTRRPATVTKHIKREVAAKPRSVPAVKSRQPSRRDVVQASRVGARVPRDVVRGSFIGSGVSRDVVQGARIRGSRIGSRYVPRDASVEEMKAALRERGLSGEIYGEAKLIPGYKYPPAPTTEEMKAALRERGFTGKFVEPGMITKEEQFHAATNGGIPSPSSSRTLYRRRWR